MGNKQTKQAEEEKQLSRALNNLMHLTTDLEVIMMYQVYHQRYLAAAGQPFEWDLNRAARVDPTGAPWTNDRNRMAVFVTNYVAPALHALNDDAVKPYLLELRGAEVEKARADRDEAERQAARDDDRIPCRCDFVQLEEEYRTRNDQKGLYYLLLNKLGCERSVDGVYWFACKNYRQLLEGCAYMAPSIRYEFTAVLIQQMLDSFDQQLQKTFPGKYQEYKDVLVFGRIIESAE